MDVTGGGIEAHAEDSDTGTVYDTPDVAGIPDQTTPFTSFDLDDFQTCECDDVDWAASGAPAGWTVAIDAENVVTVTAPDAATEPAEMTFTATFHWPGVDCEGSDTAVFTPNRPPIAHPGKIYPDEWYEVDEGSSVEVDGSQSYDPDGDAIVYYGWDFNDDAIFEVEGVTADFSAAALDNPPVDHINIFLKVCDEHGACAINRTRVFILDLAPTAAFSSDPEPQFKRLPVDLTDESTSVVDDIVAWGWDFAGLGASTDQNPTFTFMETGVYSVCLTVTDDDGSTDTTCQDVTVLNRPPDCSGAFPSIDVI